jgi:hypothetical protein
MGAGMIWVFGEVGLLTADKPPWLPGVSCLSLRVFGRRRKARSRATASVADTDAELCQGRPLRPKRHGKTGTMPKPPQL